MRYEIFTFNINNFNSEKELTEKLKRIQLCADEEFGVKLVDEVTNRIKNFYFVGTDGLVLVGIMLYRGMLDFVFDLDMSLRFVVDDDIDDQIRELQDMGETIVIQENN